MNFGEALENLKLGHKVRREGWNGKGMFIYLVEGQSLKRFELKNEADKHLQGNDYDDIAIGSHIDMKDANGNIVVGWLASQSDMLAEDWEVVE